MVLHHQDGDSRHGLRNDVLLLHAWGIDVDLPVAVDSVVAALLVGVAPDLSLLVVGFAFELEKKGYR